MPKITAKAARVNADLTLREAAEKLGIPYQRLSNLENDEDKITLGLAKKMSQIYQIPMDFIFK